MWSQINHILTFLMNMPECTKTTSALAVSHSLVFALSPFTVKVPAAISSPPSPSWLTAYIQQYAAPVQAGLRPASGGGAEDLAAFLRPQAFLFQCAYCLTLRCTERPAWLEPRLCMYIGVCMWMSASVFMWENRVRRVTSVVPISDRPASLSLPNPQKHLFRPRYMTEVCKAESCHRRVLFPLKNVTNVFSRLKESKKQGVLETHEYVGAVEL